jgi:DNA helicase-2/ATP-dependent DNA helicase PcrA
MLEMVNNKLMIAAAGSGKTQFIVNRALEILKHNPSASILITTYTINNREEIKERFLKLNNKFIPENITIQTWFSFLLQHGAKPYKYDSFQSEIKIDGMLPLEVKPPLYLKKDSREFYLKNNKFYSDRISSFAILCNLNNNGASIARLAEIYTDIFIDEVQDFSSTDLDFLKLLLQSKIKILSVGDPRQTIYSTNNGNKNKKYKYKIREFIENECKDICEIDETTLNNSHRNGKEICDFASELYPDFKKTEPCNDCIPLCHLPNEHTGIFLVKRLDVKKYLETQEQVIQLRNNKNVETEESHPAYNFGASKGKTFDRVLIYPTDPIVKYLKDGKLQKKVQKKGKTEIKNAFSISDFYVALTRARYSVGIVLDYDEKDVFINGIKKWNNL